MKNRPWRSNAVKPVPTLLAAQAGIEPGSIIQARRKALVFVLTRFSSREPAIHFASNAGQDLARKRNRAEGYRFLPAYDWQKRSGKVTLTAKEGIEECPAIKMDTLSGRTAWLPRNDPGRSIGGAF
jgi:hypothetical protein